MNKVLLLAGMIFTRILTMIRMNYYRFKLEKGRFGLPKRGELLVRSIKLEKLVVEKGPVDELTRDDDADDEKQFDDADEPEAEDAVDEVDSFSIFSSFKSFSSSISTTEFSRILFSKAIGIKYSLGIHRSRNGTQVLR